MSDLITNSQKSIFEWVRSILSDQKSRFYLLGTYGFFIIIFSWILTKRLSPIGNKNYQIDSPKDKERVDLNKRWAGKLPESAQEILDIMNYPEVYAHFSSQLPKGLLLHGLPGTGKTHYARMICELTNAEFFYATASEFDELYVGVGAQRIRSLFDSAIKATTYSSYELFMAFLKKETLPQKRSIIFIDELDALGNRNGSPISTSTTHSTVSQLLTCLDGLTGRENVFIIAATNNIANIDPALRRSGRFDRVVVMPLPDKESRYALHKYYLGKQPGVEEMFKNGFISELSELTEGFSAADIKNMINEATMHAIQETIAQSKKEKKRLYEPVNPRECFLSKNHLLKSLLNIHSKIMEERKALLGKFGEVKLKSLSIIQKKCLELKSTQTEKEVEIDSLDEID